MADFASVEKQSVRSLEDLNRSDMRLVAFYLPQFHPVTENSNWWGPGFTEWTNVAKAKPNYKGHYQPHIPRDLGFYDLRLPQVMADQAAMAQKFGISAFCFYYYWFAGRRILEAPVDNWVASNIDFPYCVCWANENWTKRWDGGSGEVLLAQEHSEDDFVAFFDSVLPMLRDPRYLRVDNKPVLLVYRPTLFPDSRKACELWRECAVKAGLPGLHLCTVHFYGIENPQDLGFDAAVEFPPHKFVGGENASSTSNVTNPEFSGQVIDYRKIVQQSLKREEPPYLMYRGVMPSWDNTARRQNDPFIIQHSSPEIFQYWLSRMIKWTEVRRPKEQRMVFINAWNEWGEGCHLEPDLRYGTRFLEACFSALHARTSEAELANALGIKDGNLELIASIPPTLYDRERGGVASFAEAFRFHIFSRNGSQKIVRGISSFVRRNMTSLHRPLRRLYYLLKSTR